ncbi:HTH-type transcriptional repressor KstR2 [Geobacter sp. OR-1]|uniref:TetR/AcrR family transcriptional regulator n=1 Tax=Geobacter sp. OR-1 TaxID=1266765 RepID=UPI000541FA9C|nr:TetR/AcrR family transcriptional regulator [Geobacter sp. OR-1]GAM09883.1 HTH-type transcriptional repressor KstR2 [Geobacter sp. OR-1]
MTEEATAGAQANQAVRERLLAEGLRLFTSKGYAGTTVREIVEAAGVTKPVLYYYFNSKEGIYLELMEGAYTIFGERMRELVGKSGSARDRMEILCLGIFDAFLEFIDVARLIYAIYFGPAQGAPQFEHDQAFDWMLDAVRTVVAEGIASGEFRPGDPADMTWVIIGCLNVCMEEQLCRNDPRINRDDTKRMLALILDGISRGDAK